MKECFDTLRKNGPLIHNITNYVTVTDVANLLLACGASPIMADDMAEVEEISALCGGLCINIGTLNQRSISSMHLAAAKATSLGHKLVLDPVGAGASTLRTNTARELMDHFTPTVIRGNISEIKTLAQGSGKTKGVDADASEAVTEENLEASIRFAKILATATDGVIAITGAIDLVADSTRCYVIRNGRPEMGQITGTGCQLSALICAFVTANPDRVLEATAAAVCAMGLAGEIGFSHLQPHEGNATYRNRIIDAIYHMDGEGLAAGARYELR